MNMSASHLIDSLDKLNKFERWLNTYSFKWVPDFCKPIIKGWVKDAYLAGFDEGKDNG